MNHHKTTKMAGCSKKYLTNIAIAQLVGGAPLKIKGFVARPMFSFLFL